MRLASLLHAVLLRKWVPYFFRQMTRPKYAVDVAVVLKVVVGVVDKVEDGVSEADVVADVLPVLVTVLDCVVVGVVTWQRRNRPS